MESLLKTAIESIALISHLHNQFDGSDTPIPRE
jgi:hypothetical protein